MEKLRCNNKKTTGILQYSIVTFTLSWFLWMLPVPGHIGNFVPSVTGLFFIVKSRGREEHKIGMKFKYSITWYVFTVAAMPSILLAAFIISHLASGLEFRSLLIPMFESNILSIFPVMIYFIIVQGPIGEEFGWRGYALPALMRFNSPATSGIILGVIWSIWHFPKFLIEGSIQESIASAYGIYAALAGYTFYTVMISIMITLLYIKTSGSLWSSVLFHAAANFSHGLITIVTEVSGAVSILFVMALSTGYALLRFRKELW